MEIRERLISTSPPSKWKLTFHFSIVRFYCPLLCLEECFGYNYEKKGVGFYGKFKRSNFDKNS